LHLPFTTHPPPAIYTLSLHDALPISIPNLNIEFQNRLRELRDLLLNPDQEGQIIDETAAKVYTPGQPSWVDIDRAMWDYNPTMVDRKSTRLNSSHVKISYAVFCLKKK